MWSGGICTSTIATSGWWAATLRRRSSASADWATTSKPASVSSRLSPSRSRSWSSATTTRKRGTTGNAIARGMADRTSPVRSAAVVGERAGSKRRLGEGDAVGDPRHAMTPIEESAMTQPAADASAPNRRRRVAGHVPVRYGLGAVMVLGGVVMLIVSPGGLGFDGFAMAVGGGFSVVLFNVLFRLGLSSEADRERGGAGAGLLRRARRVARGQARPGPALGASRRRRHLRAGAGADAGPADGRVGGLAELTA